MITPAKLLNSDITITSRGSPSSPLVLGMSPYSALVGSWVKGEATSLYANGAPNEQNLRSARGSKRDLLESVRQRINEGALDNVAEIIQERNGEVSVIKKQRLTEAN